MNFYHSKFNRYYTIPQNCLCVSTDKRIAISGRNLINPYDGIFEYDGEEFNADDYFNSVSLKMRKANFNGFVDWISKTINHFNDTIYHIDDKPIKYESIIFLVDNEKIIKCLYDLFTNFGFSITEYGQKPINNSLF